MYVDCQADPAKAERTSPEAKKGGDRVSDLRNNPYAAWAQGFSTIDADTLMYKPLPKSSFLVDGLIPQGVNILCGASKIGKSWMVLDLALKVAAGEPVWGIETTKCDVLYLCLEDTYQRIQDRLMTLTDEAPANLRFSVAANSLSCGLDKDIINYLYAYPETKLIIIDTLQKIRAEKDKFSGGLYASDYEDMSVLKKLAAERGIAFLLVHHLRKQKDTDVFNQVSGSAGIVGAADTTYVLQKDSRCMDSATLICTGRDIEFRQLRLKFENLRWVLIEKKEGDELKREQIPSFLFQLVDFMRDRAEWSGSATELLAVLGDRVTSPSLAVKSIVRYYYEVLSPAGMDFRQKRTNKARLLIFSKRDASDGGDGKNGI